MGGVSHRFAELCKQLEIVIFTDRAVESGLQQLDKIISSWIGPRCFMLRFHVRRLLWLCSVVTPLEFRIELVTP